MTDRMASAIDRPTAVWLEISRILALPWIRAGFALHGVKWNAGWRVFGMPMIQKHRGSRIVLGKRVSLRSWQASNPLVPNHPVMLATRSRDAVLTIGDDTGLTGATVVAEERVEIGNRVLVGANAVIVDTDFHPLDPQERAVDICAGIHKPVVIEDDVFIGMHSIILKGVRIGKGSVVGAGSVVSADVPAGVIVAGNPARVVRSLSREVGATHARGSLHS